MSESLCSGSSSGHISKFRGTVKTALRYIWISISIAYFSHTCYTSLKRTRSYFSRPQIFVFRVACTLKFTFRKESFFSYFSCNAKSLNFLCTLLGMFIKKLKLLMTFFLLQWSFKHYFMFFPFSFSTFCSFSLMLTSTFLAYPFEKE